MTAEQIDPVHAADDSWNSREKVERRYTDRRWSEGQRKAEHTGEEHGHCDAIGVASAHVRGSPTTSVVAPLMQPQRPCLRIVAR
jgi:hypothetical protein